MNKLGFLALAAASSIALTVPGHAVTVIDQSQPSNPVFMAQFDQEDLAQSFMPSLTTSVGAGIFLQPNQGTTGLVTIALWDALPNAGGSLLASGSASGTQGSWVDVFWSGVSVTPSSTYYLVFSSDNTLLGISGDLNDPYAGGQVYANSGFQSFPNFDYAFRTYADVNGAAVPEPGTWAMMLLGFGAMGWSFKRRRKLALA